MSEDNNQSDDGCGAVSIEQLPLEIIAYITSFLDVADILSLSQVNRLWRCVFINQNVIWKRVCHKLDLCNDTEYGGGDCPYTDDWLPCRGPTFRTKTVSTSPWYVVRMSTKTFGQQCRWWTVYNRYSIVLHNLVSDNYSTVTVPYAARPVKTHWCAGKYEVMLGCRLSVWPVSIMMVEGSAYEFKHTPLVTPISFNRLFAKYSTESSPNVAGNSDFLVLEIHSVVFVFAIDSGRRFQFRYAKTVGKDNAAETVSGSAKPDGDTDTSTVETLNHYSVGEQFEIPDKRFIHDHNGTKIALYSDKLVVVHPRKNTLFIIDLNSGRVCKRLEYTKTASYVQLLSFYENLILLGLNSRQPSNPNENEKNLVVIYDMVKDKRHEIVVPCYINRFDCNHAIIAVNILFQPSVFIRRTDYSVFKISCCAFALSPSGKHIFYFGDENHHDHRVLNIDEDDEPGVDNNNKSLYWLTVGHSANGPLVKLMTGIPQNFKLKAINDRFLVIYEESSSRPLDVFDTKYLEVVKSLPKPKNHKVQYVGKRFIVTNNHMEVTVVGYG